MPRCHPSRQPLQTLRHYGFLAPGALTLYLAAKGAHPSLPGLSCPLRALSGIPCPTCFLTRATAAALQLRLDEALHLHAFGIPLAVLLVAWSALAIRRRHVLPLQVGGWQVAWAAVALVIYWLGRLVAQVGLGVAAFPQG